jgi:hypothetical protein
MSNLKTAGRPKGYAKWRPHKKTWITLESVDQVLVDYQEHLPLTIRQVFYRLSRALRLPENRGRL